MGMIYLISIFIAIAVIKSIDGACNVSSCQIIIYKDCPAQAGCGTGCEYLPLGLISKPSCASNPCTAVTGIGQWQNICSGIDALEISGSCTAKLARSSNGANPYNKVFKSGFSGIWQTYENGTHFGDNAASVKMTCIATDICASNSTNNCSSNAYCNNTGDSFNCTCKPGYKGDGVTCSDVNECLSNSLCSIDAHCTNTMGSYVCSCKVGYFGNGVVCDVGVQRVVCKNNKMEFYFDPRLIIDNTTSITLRDPSCSVKKYLPSNEYGLITNQASQCGTTSKETASHIVYENEVIWKYSDATKAIISRSSGKRITFSCSVPRFFETGISQILVPTTMVNESEAGYGNFSMSLRMYSSPVYTSQFTTFPATINQNENVYFESYLDSFDNDITLLVDQCSASPTLDKNHPLKYFLIKDRCGVDSSVQFISTNDTHRTRFSFKAFRFVGQSNNIYLQCQVFMCHNKLSTDSRCTSGCASNNIQRQKRSIEDIQSRFYANNVNVKFGNPKIQSIQKRDIPSEYSPSETYSLSIGPFVKGKSQKQQSSGTVLKSTVIYAVGMFTMLLMLSG